MSDFEYTHNPITKHSDAVDEVWYNENTKELAVDLHDEVYVYSGVPKTRYEAFVNAPSLGRAFREIKKDYGPSEYLGDVDEVEFDYASYPAADFGPVGTPKNLTYAENATVDGVRVSGSGNSGNSSGLHLSLTPAGAAPATAESRRHRVVFETPHGVKSHDVDTSDVDAAKAVVENFSTLLGVDVTVKEVTVYFE